MSLPVINPLAVNITGGDPEETTIVCDLCCTSIYQPTPYGKPILNPMIRREYGNAACVQVSQTTGEQDWDWGAGEITTFTICPKCFEEKLVPWLELKGAVPKTKSWSR